MNKLKMAAALLILMATGAVAQTITTSSSLNESLTVNVPCTNSGRGELITFTAKVYPILQTINVNGIKHGVQYYSVNNFTGIGQTTHKTYAAWGSKALEFSGLDTLQDGDFKTTVTLSIHGPVNVEFRNVGEFVVTNSGNLITFPLGLDGYTVCK